MACRALPTPRCSCLPTSPFSRSVEATPYRLIATDPNSGPCNETNNVQSAFVRAAIFDPATGQISVYHPLVIDVGAKSAAAPSRSLSLSTME